MSKRLTSQLQHKWPQQLPLEPLQFCPPGEIPMERGPGFYNEKRPIQGQPIRFPSWERAAEVQGGAWALDSSHTPGLELQVHLSGCLIAWCLLNTVLRLVGVPMAEPREQGFLVPFVPGARCVTRAAPVRRTYMRHPLSSKCKALDQVLFHWCCWQPSLLALGI